MRAAAGAWLATLIAMASTSASARPGDSSPAPHDEAPVEGRESNVQMRARREREGDSPSVVRERVLFEHRLLRAQLAELEQAANRVLAGKDAALVLRRLGLEMLDALETHMDNEERALVPTLEAIDSWGIVRVARLEEDHAHQRAVIAALRDDVDGSSNKLDAEIADEVRWFIGLLRKDMAREERELLSPELLRDDAVVVGQFGG